MQTLRLSICFFAACLVPLFCSLAWAQVVPDPRSRWVPDILGQPRVSIGSLSDAGNSRFSYSVQDGGNLFGVVDFGQAFSVSGVWVEATFPVIFSPRTGLSLSVARLFPGTRMSNETVTFTTGPTARQWTNKVSWWNVEAILTYDLNPASVAVAGFRFDTFMINFLFPNNQDMPAGTPTDLANFTFTGYIPFMGFMLRTTVGPGTVEAGALAWPALPGSFSYSECLQLPSLTVPGNLSGGLHSSQEFASGRFFKAFGVWAFPMGPMRIGAFVRYRCRDRQVERIGGRYSDRIRGRRHHHRHLATPGGQF